VNKVTIPKSSATKRYKLKVDYAVFSTVIIKKLINNFENLQFFTERLGFLELRLVLSEQFRLRLRLIWYT